MASNSKAVEAAHNHIAADTIDCANSSTRAHAMSEPAASAHVEIANQSRTQIGGELNRFLLCVLVSKSAKRIKASAEKMGESLPMPMVVRAFLRSYRLATQDGYRPLPGPDLDTVNLKNLGDRVLRDEIARHSRDRVRTSEGRLAYAMRVGDDARIKAEKEGLDLAIKLRDKRANQAR